MSLESDIISIAQQAKIAASVLAMASQEEKNNALEKIAQGLLLKTKVILQANKKDVACAKKEKKSNAFIDRLSLTAKQIEKISLDVRTVIALQDPVGEMMKIWRRPNGLMIGKMRVPIGVIGIIYESRPNVTSDCAVLCLKAGNAVILRGGKESINSNIAIYNVIESALEECGMPKGSVSLIKTKDRKAVTIMLGLSDYIDLIIPRGGESLIRSVVEKSKIPVIKHYKGICHTYVDEYADLVMAEEVCFNASC